MTKKQRETIMLGWDSDWRAVMKKAKKKSYNGAKLHWVSLLLKERKEEMYDD